MKKRLYSEETLSKRKKIIIVLSIIAVLIVAVLILMKIFYYKQCDNWNCFNENLAKCKKTKFAGGDTILYGYEIKGKTNDTCEVEVTLLEGQLNNQDTISLKGKSMTCYLENGVVADPESDTSKCHGELKESLQEQVISKLYTYLIQNIGQINKNIVDPLGVIDE